MRSNLLNPEHRVGGIRGFTLIEIMVVIAIIGVLAAIAIPNFVSYRNKAYCSSAETDARNIAGVIANYFSNPERPSLPTLSDFTVYHPDTSVASYTLTGNNSGSVAGTTDAAVITITDATGRCPKGVTYVLSVPVSSADGWQ